MATRKSTTDSVSDRAGVCRRLAARGLRRRLRAALERAGERGAPARLLREALAAYGLTPADLRAAARMPPADLREALSAPAPPSLLLALLEAQAALLAPEPREPIRCAADLAGLLMLRMGHLDQEQLVAVCLDSKMRVQRLALVYRGCVNQAVARMAEIFKPAIRLNSPSLILAHNHPSGVAAPSPDDIVFTRACARAADLLDITLHDHLIIGAGSWVSLAQRGLLER